MRRGVHDYDIDECVLCQSIKMFSCMMMRVWWTFASWRKSIDAQGIIQWTFANWRKSRVFLAKNQWTLANWWKSTKYVGESWLDFRQWRKSYWRNSGKPIKLFKKACQRNTYYVVQCWYVLLSNFQNLLAAFVLNNCSPTTVTLASTRVLFLNTVSFYSY